MFRYDAATGTTIKVSQTFAGGETDKDSNFGAISGKAGTWRTRTHPPTWTRPGTPTGGAAYLYDAETGSTTRVSHGTDGIARVGIATGVSDNGKIVSFYSDSNSMVPGKTDKNWGAFFWNATTDRVKLISTARPEWPNGVSAQSSGVSGNGRYLTFDARPADDPYRSDVYLFDRQTGQTTRISVTPAGGDANSGSGNSSLSHRGDHIAFGSNATNLAPGDTQGDCIDIFLWSRTIG